MNTLYTLGYTRLKPDEILRAAERLDAVIADIRIAPRSRHPMWNGAKMRAAWRERYVHIPELGNENYKGDRGDGVMLANPEAGSSRVLDLLARQSVILLCACADWQTCHRRAAAELIGERAGVEVTHLSVEDVRRLASPDVDQQMLLF